MFPALSARGLALVCPVGPCTEPCSLLLGTTRSRRSCPRQSLPDPLASPENNKTYISKYSGIMQGTLAVLSKYLLSDCPRDGQLSKPGLLNAATRSLQDWARRCCTEGPLHADQTPDPNVLVKVNFIFR